jgi:hypothetical protein
MKHQGTRYARNAKVAAGRTSSGIHPGQSLPREYELFLERAETVSFVLASLMCSTLNPLF